MNAQGMLEQLLKSGLSMLESRGSPAGTAPAPGAGAGSSPARDAGWGKFGAGAATGGALGLLLGSKRGRSFGGKALKLGSVAAIGAIAYKAYEQWQRSQAAGAAQGTAPQGQPMPGAAAQQGPAPGQPLPAPRTVNLLPPPEIELHSLAMLGAMVAAAKADGHIDDRERGLVDAELGRLGADEGTRRWFDDELRRPLDPAEVARSATTPELAAEMYLASLLVVDETGFMERAYLDELARRLELPEGLKAELERQARSG